MSILKNPKSELLSLFVIILFTINLSQAQQFNLNNSESTLTVLGTSSLHDWHITEETQSGTIVFENIDNCNIKDCNIIMNAESLKSGKNSMDKNTYKALKTDDYKTINFQLTNVEEVTNKGNGIYSVKSIGNLTIAGVKKQIILNFTASINGSKINLTGEKKIKMTDFNINPPKALFGTITTGDDITIKFSTTFI
ncbi:YceI family protein [Thalassobellus citreus]|uniref:YceI family protein n=1 Tax=Thalassobellus citreus TaxID=3367752 RepID=UPI00379D0663